MAEAREAADVPSVGEVVFDALYDAFKDATERGEHDRAQKYLVAMIKLAVGDREGADEPFTPGQYRNARGIAPPAAGEPSVEETIRKLRGDDDH